MAERERVNTIEYLRTRVMRVTQQDLAQILGMGIKSIYMMEIADTDRITMAQIRLMHRWCVDNDIRWSDSLMNRLLEREPSDPSTFVVRVQIR